MRRFLTEVLMRQRYSHNIVKKTDDELTRYLKQTRIIERRQKFEEAMKLEALAKSQTMNTREIRMQHYLEMQALERKVYDKGYINDNLLEYDYLLDSENYRPLGQKWRPFYLLPPYARPGDWEHKAGSKRQALRLVLGALLAGAGYQVGSWDSKDELLNQRSVVEFETEEQIYDLLLNKKKMAVFLFLYTPGTKFYEDFNNVFDRESSKYQLAFRKSQDPECEEDEEDDIVFMRVHCRKHLNFCTNKQWPGRIQPSAEVYALDERGQVQIVDFEDWHRSAIGIEGFFTKHGLIEDRFNPEELLERGGRKFMQII